MKKTIMFICAALCMMTACKKEIDIDPEENDTTPVSNVTEGAIDALYSVSAEQQVRFSKGNLQYQATSATFRFAEHQWDRIGADNENISQYYGGWIDLFGWATSGWDCGNTYYMPYDHSFVDNYDLGMGYGPLPSRDHDLVGEYANCDWGVYNAISNGGNKPGLWRTLSSEEWIYLLTQRQDAKKKYAAGAVDGLNGLVLLPDNWTLPEGCTFNAGMGDGDGREYFAQKNNYTSAQWQKMEQNGAVFLPAGGVRQEFSEIIYVGEVGRYWSVTRCQGTAYLDEWCAYSLYFDSETLLPSDPNNPRDYGRHVRLVCDAE